MKKKRQFLYNILRYCIFIFYLVVLFMILFRSRHTTRMIKLVPFATISNFLLRDIHIFTVSNLFGNILLFVPLGIYLVLYGQGKKKAVFWVFLTSLAVEMIQTIFKMGVGDIDDIILNTFGGFLGIVGYSMIMRKIQEEEKAKNVAEIMAGILSVFILILYKMIQK